MNPYAAGPTVENSISRTPINDNTIAANSKIYSTYEPSSQMKYSNDKYLIAEKIQSALRQQPAYAEVANTKQLLIQSIKNSFTLHYHSAISAAHLFKSEKKEFGLIFM